MQRECTVCKKIKPFEEFSKSSKGKFGIDAQCKKCRYAKTGRAHYLNNKTKCHENAKAWSKRNREKINQRVREKYDEDPTSTLQRIRKYRKYNKAHLQSYRKRNREKINAQVKLRDHVKRGNIVKPDHCSICRSSEWIEAHHSDYSKPLEVLWVCKKCHNAIHKRLSTIKKQEK